MPKFTIRRYVDAYAVYEAEVEADDADAATILAANSEEKFNWSEPYHITYDSRTFVAIDVLGDPISKEIER